jgi:signal transduction histidine kinase
MSHELRTPLTSIIGFGKLLEEQAAGELGVKQKKYSRIIVTSANQLLDLINEILSLVKMEQYRDKVSPSPGLRSSGTHEGVRLNHFNT